MRVLLVDDEAMSRHGVSFFLRMALDCDVTECENGRDALERFSREPFPVVISDIRMPEMDGLELLHEIHAHPEGADTAVILMTGFADVDSAVIALREGAYDYLHKPVRTETLAAVLAKLTEERAQKAEPSKSPAAEIPRPALSQTVSVPGYGNVGAFSPVMRGVVELAYRLHQDRGVPALIEGETGTGKEVVARLIHHGQGESAAPFICINCPAIAPSLFESELFGYEAGSFTGAKKSGNAGKLELAQGGTLFLDEIGDMPLELQPKLLRVLQEREMYRVGGGDRVALDVRIIAATNANLAKLVEEGRFRRDLYYRLNLGHVRIPPLRERAGEIVHLAQMFLGRYAEEKRRAFRFISPGAREILEQYSWPGNIRELQNTIERVILLYNEEHLRPDHLSFLTTGVALPADSRGPTLSPENFVLPEDELDIDALHDAIVKRVLEKFDGNKSEAARYLKLTRGSLRRRVDRLGEE